MVVEDNPSHHHHGNRARVADRVDENCYFGGNNDADNADLMLGGGGGGAGDGLAGRGWRGKQPAAEVCPGQGAIYYQDRILTAALPFIRGRGSRRATKRRRIFRQDGASCHTAASTKAWLQSNQV